MRARPVRISTRVFQASSSASFSGGGFFPHNSEGSGAPLAEDSCQNITVFTLGCALSVSRM